MKICKFVQTNCIYAKNQPEYLPLLVHKDVEGIVTSCWKAELIERIKILFTGKVYLQLMTFNQPLQPQLLHSKNPLANNKGGECYATEKETGHG